MLRSLTRRGKLLLLAASVVILALGAIENQYGNTDGGDVYGSDGVQYLDIARNIGHGDWHSALNPLWSQGYPALLAGLRHAFPAGPLGDWRAVRTLNFCIFAANYAAILYLFLALFPASTSEEPNARRRTTLAWTAALVLFSTTQICMGQVSRVNPDELVTTFFFLACGTLIRLLRRRVGRVWMGLLLGLMLGGGFLVKAIFLPLGCGILIILSIALWKQRASLLAAAVAAALFCVVVLAYGTALSRAAGYRTLGEAGAVNYAWHVNRLQKWVHWEGGTETAAEAWPSARIARFARWEAQPPDFGTPLHPSRILQKSPRVYGFAAPFHATYTPYYNPPYWYQGYRHIVRPRFQLVAIFKSLADLTIALLKQPILYALLLVLVLLRAGSKTDKHWLRSHWPVVACGVLAVVIYLPVHLEGRYLSGFLAFLALCAVLAALQATTLTPSRFKLVAAVLFAGMAADFALYQIPVWRNMLHHKSPTQNAEWQIGEAVLAQNLPPASQVAVIAWTPNLHCDWAYIGNLQITSEIGSGPDFNLFWNSPAAAQQATLATFQRAGAVAVFVNGKPNSAAAHEAQDGPHWQQLGDTSMWMYRF